jgi:dTDP-4-dehydrorhamnose reductase
VSQSKDILFSRVLVTGANGLLGQALVRTLSSAPRYDVLASARDALLFAEDVSCGYTPIDITDFNRVRQAFEDFSPTVVVNCAAMTQVDVCETEREQCWRVNVEAVENLASMCRITGARFVQVSTDFVFDGEGGPYRETDRPSPINFYGKSKLASENVSREAGEERWAVVRTILVYGKESRLSRSNFLLWVANELTAGRSIAVVTDQVRSPTYNVDLAHGIERLIRKRGAGIYHMGGNEMLTVFDFAGRIAEILGLDQSLILPTDSSRFSQPARRPLRTGFDLAKAVRELGYHPRSIREAIQHLAPKLSL